MNFNENIYLILITRSQLSQNNHSKLTETPELPDSKSRQVTVIDLVFNILDTYFIQNIYYAERLKKISYQLFSFAPQKPSPAKTVKQNITNFILFSKSLSLIVVCVCPKNGW